MAIALGIVGTVAGIAAVVLEKQASNKEKKKQKSAAEAARDKANAIEQEAKMAEINASEEAKQETRKRLASLSKTIYTTPLGLDTNATTKKTMLGSQ